MGFSLRHYLKEHVNGDDLSMFTEDEIKRRVRRGYEILKLNPSRSIRDIAPVLVRD